MSSTIEIKATDVQKLRQMTGAGLMDCKKALSETNGNMDLAMKLLREKGIAKSSQRADRVAGEGVVDVWISPDSKEGILFEMNCETDFVARNDEFLGLTKKIIEQIKTNQHWADATQIPTEQVLELSGKIGEKMEARRFTRLKSANGVVASYIHAGSKLGVMVQVDSKSGQINDNLKQLAKDLALHIAGANPYPVYITRDEVPAAVLEQEKEIAKKQMAGQNKPAEILEKIAVGKLQQFYAAQCLLEQAYIRDESGKTTIQQMIQDAGKKDGTEYVVVRFARFRVGSD